MFLYHFMLQSDIDDIHPASRGVAAHTVGFFLVCDRG